MAKYTQAKNVLGYRAARMLALLNVAIYDGMVAAWDSKHTHNRARPARTTADGGHPRAEQPVVPRRARRRSRAAATVLSYVFPDDAPMFATLADEAARYAARGGRRLPQ